MLTDVTLSGGSVVTGSTIYLNCSTTMNSNVNTSTVTYAFYKGALLLSGPANSATYSFVANVSDAGNDYKCVVNVFKGNASGTVASNYTTVVVTSKTMCRSYRDNYCDDHFNYQYVY